MCRVSSDEQAKGYSLDAQHESITRYCERNGYEIIYEIKEDHSAKSFNRPEWKKWKKYAKVNFRDIDMLLITTWDRFTRNAIDGQIEIRDHNQKWDITIQAVEQRIDFSIPEQKAMLAFYLIMPEIDNDRRSIKIKDGIRQALKQGRWIRKAPLGYRNTRDENNKPIIVPHETKASLIKYAFEAYVNGTPQSEIRRELAKKGFKIAKSSMSGLFRRETYIGKIIVPANKHEPLMIVEGVHEAIIDEDLFFKVQAMLTDGIKKGNKIAKTKTRRDELPLRGHLLCSNCNGTVTGSRSRGRLGKRYFYYHCNHCKKERYPAHVINDNFEELLTLFEVDASVQVLYNLIIEKILLSNGVDSKQEAKNIKVKLDKEMKRLENLQDLLVDSEITSDEYKSMRNRYNSIIIDLKDKLGNIKQTKNGFERYLSSGLSYMQNLSKTYINSSVELKQKIIGSIFPEKMSFDGNQCRTQKINPAVLLILSIGKEFRKNKTEQSLKFKQLFGLVESEGLEPSSKQGLLELSTRLSFSWVFDVTPAKSNQLLHLFFINFGQS